MVNTKKLVSLGLGTLLATTILTFSAQADEVPTVTMVVPFTGSWTNEGVDAVEAAINPLLEEAAGAHVELMPVQLSNFTERMTLMASAREGYDIAMTAPWLNDFYRNVAEGNFIALNDYLDEVPELTNAVSQAMLDAGAVNGNVYGITNQQYWPRSFGYAVRADAAEKSGLDYASVESFRELTPLLEKYVANTDEGGYAVSGPLSMHAEILGHDAIVNQNALYATVAYDDETRKVVNLFDSEGYRDLMRLRREWREAGLANPDPISREDARQAAVSGLTAFRIDSVQDRPNNRTLDGVSFKVKRIAPLFLTTSSINASMLAVSADSDHPLEALKVIATLQYSPEIYNLFAHGIEGRNWKYQDGSDTLVSKIEGSDYDPNVDWMWGNTYLATPYSQDALNANAEAAKINAEATPSVMLGFSPDLAPVENEVIALASIVDNFKALETGQVEDVDTYIDEQVARMNGLGLDRVLAELQSQVDAWAAAE